MLLVRRLARTASHHGAESEKGATTNGRPGARLRWTSTLVEQARALGIHEIIYKPLSVDELALAVRRLLGEPARANA